MISANPQSGYSSTVKLELIVDGKTHQLGSVGPDFITFRNPVALPASSGQIVMTIDDERSVWPVKLLNGCEAGSTRAMVERITF